MKKTSIFPAIQRAFPEACACARLPVKTTIEATCVIEVDYNVAFEEMVKRSGLKLEHGFGEKIFPVMGSGKYRAEIAIFSFEGFPTTGRVREEMGIKGFLPAKVEDMFALVEQHPEVAGDLSIIFLGSVWVCGERSYSPMVAINPVNGKRIPNFAFNDIPGWVSHFKFAGIKILASN